eukprot:5045820-Ditylum_brightwellii.AAC.1
MMGTCAGAECFFDYHNDMLLGMAQEDVTLKGDKKNWPYPSQSKVKENAKLDTELAKDLNL